MNPDARLMVDSRQFKKLEETRPSTSHGDRLWASFIETDYRRHLTTRGAFVSQGIERTINSLAVVSSRVSGSETRAQGKEISVFRVLSLSLVCVRIPE